MTLPKFKDILLITNHSPTVWPEVGTELSMVYKHIRTRNVEYSPEIMTLPSRSLLAPGPLPRVADISSWGLPSECPHHHHSEILLAVLRKKRGLGPLCCRGPGSHRQARPTAPQRPSLACRCRVVGSSQAAAYTMPSVRLLLQTTSAVTSSVTRTGTTMKGQRMLLGGSRTALPDTGQLLK